MLTVTIKYTDLDDQEQEEVAYFNLTKAEALELNIRQDIEVIGQNKDRNEMMDTFKGILRSSYGMRTADGKFVKKDKNGQSFFDTFETSEAYSELFLKIFGDSSYAAEFIKGILPDSIQGEPTEQASQSNVPANLADHPSMQGHKQGRRAAAEGTPSNPALNDSSSAQTQPEVNGMPATGASQDEWAAFREWKDQQRQQEYPPTYQAPITPTTPPDRVSPPEAPQAVAPTRDDLV